ncbi:MAG: hypothetical protein QM770_00805 [Tepidisphaeraceae bacterium]
MAMRDDNTRPQQHQYRPDTPAPASEGERKNEDPITGARGAHPVGVGVGAAAGGAAGAAIGSVVPGAGTVVGAIAGTVVGAVAGGYTGKALSEGIFPTEENEYWRNAYKTRPYYDASATHDYDSDYAAAYRYGYLAASEYTATSFDAVEDELQRGWESSRGPSRLSWAQARHAVKDSFERARSNASA